MKKKISLRCFFAVLLFSIVSHPFAPALFAEDASHPKEISLDNVAPGQTESLLATLSDEQIRSLLVQELQKKTDEQLPESRQRADLMTFIVNWLHFADTEEVGEIESRMAKASNHIGNLAKDIGTTFQQFSGDRGGFSSGLYTILIFSIFILALGVEKIFKVLTANFHRQLLEQSVPQLKGLMRFWASILNVLPSLTSLVIYAGSAFLFFLLSPLSTQKAYSLLVMAILFVISFTRIVTLLCTVSLAPEQPSLRLFDISDSAAQKFQFFIKLSLIAIGVIYCLIALLRELGMNNESLMLLIYIFATGFLLLIGYFVLLHRQSIAEAILTGQNRTDGGSWIVQQFASIWHVLALFYLFIIWLNFLYMNISGKAQDKGALLLSLFAIPFFLLLDRIGQWAVRTIFGTLRIPSAQAEDATSIPAPGEMSAEEKEQLLVKRVGSIVRLALFLATVVWVLNLWNYRLPFATAITQAVFESLVTLALALLFWQFAAGYIEKKIQETTPEKSQEEKDSDDGEWGAAAGRGRSYTLLPMARKFIGTVLTVMVTLIILSSIGVNIGPLLAGAGVIGLAVGFGAQKLVSDILSGFFYLLDDAFRVGEYLKAGSLSGTVENITLRNVMLRHHRGMLQIVPYSELGSITNYMRGGIVEKFNLEFPYGTDIDLVRRIIKKVGKAMLTEDEFKDDFINPVKSQGVSEITNSVIVIRVKYTAKPGTQFLIRREAYRRITDALEAKGIFYAHRKVIVELPENNEIEDKDRQKIAEAGAAAGLASITEEERKAAEAAQQEPTS